MKTPLYQLLDRPDEPVPHMRLYDSGRMRDWSSRPAFADEPSEYRRRVERVMEHGPLRRLVAPHHAAVTDLLALAERMPHCVQVIEEVANALFRELLSEQPVLRFPPLAIGGPPGIGKTWLVQEIARILGTASRLIPCAEQVTGMKLTGLDRGYGTAYPGEIASYLCESPDLPGNPIFILDEFEKGGETFSNGESFHAAFHSLLESSTARQFQDRFFGFPIDASHINWICTVNLFDRLPDTIRSRLRYVSIEMPTSEQMPGLIQQIYDDLLRNTESKLLVTGLPPLEPAVIDQLSALQNLRAIRLELTKALNKACREYIEKGCNPETDPLLVRACHLTPAVTRTQAINFGFIPST